MLDRPNDELSGEAVGELRVKLVLKLSDVLAAEDTREDCREGTSGGCDVFAARDGRDRGSIAGQCGRALVNYQPVIQPKTQPETVDEGEPVTLAKGVEVGLGPGLGRTLAKGLGRSMVEGFVRTLAETLAESEDEG